MAAAHQLHGLLRLPPPPRPLRLRPLLVPPIPCRGRPPLATLRIPESPPQPPPKKRLSSASEAKSETAEALREENGATEAGARQVQEEEEGYVESVGAEDPAGPPDHHLAARAGLGEPVFFLLTFVAVTTSVAFTSMVAVAIPTMLVCLASTVSSWGHQTPLGRQRPCWLAFLRLSTPPPLPSRASPLCRPREATGGNPSLAELAAAPSPLLLPRCCPEARLGKARPSPKGAGPWRPPIFGSGAGQRPWEGARCCGRAPRQALRVVAPATLRPRVWRPWWMEGPVARSGGGAARRLAGALDLGPGASGRGRHRPAGPRLLRRLGVLLLPLLRSLARCPPAPQICCWRCTATTTGGGCGVVVVVGGGACSAGQRRILALSPVGGGGTVGLACGAAQAEGGPCGDGDDSGWSRRGRRWAVVATCLLLDVSLRRVGLGGRRRTRSGEWSDLGFALGRASSWVEADRSLHFGKAMRRAANSFALLADAALDELPSTMLAVRLTAMELSDLTLELSDLSQEIATGVNKSANIVQAVQDGIGQMRTLARQQVHRMMEERENLRNNTSAGPAKSSPDSSSQ